MKHPQRGRVSVPIMTTVKACSELTAVCVHHTVEIDPEYTVHSGPLINGQIRGGRVKYIYTRGSKEG